jgi:hypothetical protein
MWERPPPPKYPPCVLVPKDSKDRFVLEHAALLREGKTAPLTLASHAGLAIAPQWDAPFVFGDVTVFDTGLGPSELALSARLEELSTVFRGKTTTSFFLVADPPQGIQEEMVFDVKFGLFREGTQIGLLYGAKKSDTFDTGNFSRHYLLNDDGTVSPSNYPSLVFGVASNRLDNSRIILAAKDSPGCLVFENAAHLRRGEDAALTLTSHPGMAIVPIVAEKLYEERYYSTGIGIGPADGAVVAGLQDMTHTFRGETSKCSFLLAKKQLSFVDELVLDIEGGDMSVGTRLNLLREVGDGINLTFTPYGGRLFTVNEDGTVSPQTAPELVLAYDS